MVDADMVYLWGADVQVITKDLIEKLKKKFGTKHYEKISLEIHEGKMGADCSGFLSPLSGTDMTAATYYAKCPKRGTIDKISTKKVCLIFRKENGNVVHVAIYTGDGYLTEMWNGCERRKFIPSQWTYYGEPDWIEEQIVQYKAGDTIVLEKEYSGHSTATDAVAKKNKRNTVVDGVYHVYKVYGGAINVSKSKTSPGSWIVL